MATESQLPAPGEQPVTSDEVERAQSRAAAALERAAHAGLSAARSFEESALKHEHLAKVQDAIAEKGISHTDMHSESAIRHREAAAEDRDLAERKRTESEADLAAGTGD